MAYLGLLLLTCALAACARTGGEPHPQGGQNGLRSLSDQGFPAIGLLNQARAPGTRFIGRPGVPEDAHRVVMAMALRLKGFSSAEIERTVSVAGSERLAPFDGLDLAGFGNRKIRFSRYEAQAENHDARRIAGLVDMEDLAGRRVTASFEADYRAVGSTLVLERTRWDFTPLEFPQLDVFVVPADRLERKAAESYLRLREALLHHAVDLTDSSSWPEGRQRYLIVVMARDRLAPEAKVVMGVSRKKTGDLKETKRVHFFPYDGWPVAILPGRFDLAGPRFWVQVELAKSVQTAGKAAAARDKARKSRLIGLFSMARGG